MKEVKFLKVFFIVCCIILFFVGIVSAILYHYSKELPPISKLKEYEMMSGTKVYDKTGKLVKIFASENRRNIRLSDVSDTLLNAILAIEDDNFYQHNGIDIKGILRAFLANITTGRISQGASTITQQLARDMFLTRKRIMTRKLKEILLSLRIERTFSKDQILEMYINKTYFGAGNYGVESAAQNFFGKPVKDLNLAECALIARLPQAPSYLNPLKNYDVAVSRSKQVLNRMYELNLITSKQYLSAYNDTVKIRKRKKQKNPADYFLEYVRKYVENKYGSSTLYNGG
ncbi:MAG: transglycosylase domain-containing protein, partial [Candidatus Cloacimonetes bacterium]|nr:transglycosylase domain-containing protein [Candidatus Cloacimonadota bacterium]